MADPYPLFQILSIEGTECIGDSRPKINTNFNNLSASANFANMKVAELSAKWTSSTAYVPNVDSGYIKLASGIVFQWGKINALATNGSYEVTLPYAGMSKIFSITTTHVIASVNYNEISGPCSVRSDYNTTRFTLIQDTVGSNAISEMWMVIGA